jgi:hypothetical protein
MAAVILNTGPSLIFVGVFPTPAPSFGSSPPPQTVMYLGTAKAGVDIEIEGAFEEVMNDLGGSKFPLDRCFSGEEGACSPVLTRLDELVMRRIEALPRMGTRGSSVRGELGTVMGQEGFLFQTIFVFTNGVKPVMAANGMPLGYRFPGTLLEGSRRRGAGTRANEWTVPFKFQRVFTPATQSMLLYDHNVTATAGVAVS